MNGRRIGVGVVAVLLALTCGLPLAAVLHRSPGRRVPTMLSPIPVGAVGADDAVGSLDRGAVRNGVGSWQSANSGEGARLRGWYRGRQA